MDDLTGYTYLIQLGPLAGHKATITGRDPLFPNEDRWLVTANGQTWGVSGQVLRETIRDNDFDPMNRLYGKPK